MNFTVRVLSFVFLFLISYFLFLRPSAFAQTPPANTNPNVPNNLHNWTQNVMLEVTSSLTCLIAGVDPVNPSQECLGIDQKTHKIGFVQNGGGAIGAMGGLIAMTFTPPAHTSDFVKYLGSNFGIAKGAYADTGIGFTQLSPLLPIWTAFRNITYLLFVLVFVVIGFAIMFRVHIDPRTVMTIENQIPKIIVALVLVTFSFAIAGFLIDLMYVFMYLAHGIFSQIPGVTGLEGFNPTVLQGKNAIEIGNALSPTDKGVFGQGGFLGISMTITSSVIGVIFNFFGLNGDLGGAFNLNPANIFIHGVSVAAGVKGLIDGLSITTPTILGTSIPINFPAGPGLAVSYAAGAEVFFRNVLPNLLIFLVVSLAMLFALFRLWFTLIQAYVFILIDIIFAPFWIITGLIPGVNISFTAWLRSFASDLIVFPATLVMFLLGKVLIDAFGKAQPGSFFVPPFIGNPGSPNLMGSLIGFGIILMTPSVVNMMKALLKAPKFDISAIGQAIGVGVGSVNPINQFGRVGGIGMQIAYGRNVPVLGNIINRWIPQQPGQGQPPPAPHP